MEKWCKAKRRAQCRQSRKPGKGTGGPSTSLTCNATQKGAACEGSDGLEHSQGRPTLVGDIRNAHPRVHTTNRMAGHDLQRERRSTAPTAGKLRRTGRTRRRNTCPTLAHPTLQSAVWAWRWRRIVTASATLRAGPVGRRSPTRSPPSRPSPALTGGSIITVEPGEAVEVPSPPMPSAAACFVSDVSMVRSENC